MGARRRRVVRTGLTLVVLGGLGTGVAVLVSRHDTAAPAAPPSVVQAVSLVSGNLTKTDKVTGTLQYTDSLAVLHRIDGQSPVAPSSPSASSGGSSSGATGSNRQSAPAAAGIAALASFPTTTVPTSTTCAPAGPTTTTTEPPTSTSEPDTSSTSTTTSTTSTTTTTLPGGTTVAPATTPRGTGCGSGGSGGRGGAGGTGGRAGGSGAGGGTGRATGSGASSRSSSSASSRVTEMVTSIVRTGATVGLGDVLYTVDGRAVVALFGALPAWRTLSTTSTPGPDVHQLEQSLVSLGYDPAGDVVVDDTFDSATKAMVERWQQGLGLEVTGTVTLGSVVFVPGARAVRSVTAKVGDRISDGNLVLTLAGTAQQVVIDVPAGDEALVAPGLAVTLGSGGTGKVAVLRSATENANVVEQALIVPDKPVTGVDDGGTLNVTLTFDVADGVLIVPSDALASRLDGSYVVQVQAADGSTSWHTVEIVAVVGNKTAIKADGLNAGTKILEPSA